MKKLLIILTMCLLMIPGVTAHAETTLETDMASAGNDCIMVGVKGSYIKPDVQKIVNRLNEIRMEACREGIRIPDIWGDESKTLTMDDYVPVKWSDILQNYALIRSAEASVNPSHARTGSSGDFNELETHGENLAWASYTADYLWAINYWYSEKSYLGGHYTAMIDPSLDYVALGCFQGSDSSWYSTVSMEFCNSSWASDADLAKLNDNSSYKHTYGNCIQKIELKKKYITGYAMPNVSSLEIGKSKNLMPRYDTECDGDCSTVYPLNLTWSSSSNAIATVTNGIVKGVGAGSVTITARNPAYSDLSKTITIKKPDLKKGAIFTIGGITYKVTSKNKAVSFVKAGKTKISIPDTVTYNNQKYSVTSIEKAAMKNNRKLKSLTIGANVKTIGVSAFQGCKNLNVIKIKSKNLSKSSIKSNAFKNVKKTVKVYIPKKKYAAYKGILKKRGLTKKAKFVNF